MTQSSGIGATSCVKKLVVARSMTEASIGRANQSHRGEEAATLPSTGVSASGWTSCALELRANQAQTIQDRTNNPNPTPQNQL